MKKLSTMLLAITLTMLLTNANAAMWTLINSEFVGGTWFCTYQLDRYTTTIQSRSYCQSYINN